MARSTFRIALVTCQEVRESGYDRDLPVLADAVRKAGGDIDVEAEVEVVCWDDSDVEWGGFDLVLIRSTWDYSWRAAEYLAWAERCGAVTTLANPAEVVRWNADKRYLGDLAAAGVPVVDTRYLAPGDPVDLPADSEYVVKPTSGAGARYAARYTPKDQEAAVRHLERMHAEGLTAMVQPYVRSIDTAGERALQFFGGRFLHAIRKGAVLEPGTAFDDQKVPHPNLRTWQPTPAELAVAERALAAVPGAPELLYARVDLVDGDDGTPRVMELELVEPNLFLFLHEASVPVVAEAVIKAVRLSPPRAAADPR
ncbi:ATP-grasp domain-containing protein [Streptomyces sp. CWNU-52B]|uniref:ATP-grasp domain-containing protein n=1 Tax=unclassified Streptomyces TaxID=2593676 RepID=UPI0039C0DE09